MLEFKQLSSLFNRALAHTFSYPKWLSAFLVITASMLIFLFCHYLGDLTSGWMTISLKILPYFLSLGLYLGLGVVLVRLYHDELKKKKVSLSQTLKSSWSLILTTAYFAVPLLVLFLILWALLGLYSLITHTPMFGSFVGIVFSFIPFLIYLGVLLLIVSSAFSLFFLTPKVALTGWDGKTAVDETVKRVSSDPFSNLFLFLVSLAPLLVWIGLLLGAAFLTGRHMIHTEGEITELSWLFVLLPFAALLAPAVVFFYNFALESHIHFKKFI